MAQWRPDIVVMLMGGTYDRRIDGHLVLFDTPAGSALARSDVDAGVRIFTAAGAHVVLLTTLYGRLGWPIPGFDQQRSGFNDAWADRWNTTEGQVAAADPGVTLIDLNAMLDPGGQFATTLDGVQTRVDGVHLTPQAADLAAAWLVPNCSRPQQPPRHDDNTRSVEPNSSAVPGVDARVPAVTIT